MEDYSTRKMRLYLYIGILVAVIIAGSCLYTVYLITASHLADDADNGSEIDYYNIMLQEHLGINGDNYDSREVYTNLLFQQDRKTIVSYMESDRFDMIQLLAQSNLSKYRYENNYLSTMMALSSATAFDSENKTDQTSNERVQLVSAISDPELFVRFFLLLAPTEQGMVAGDQVNALPMFDFDLIEVEEGFVAEYGSVAYEIFGFAEHCRVTLSYFGREFYMHLSTEAGLKIEYMNDQDDSLTQKYVVG